ncbi:MAG: potassium-transporting ATPase subunit KdpA [Capsulimonadaceae bacterium]|nr:potassium-transporting ATPase subunit KdpA [Capsulimonadaceae bacterium]
MNVAGLFELLAFLTIVTLLVKPLGSYVHRVFSGERTLLDGILLPIERTIYRICRINSAYGMDALKYCKSFVLFSFSGCVLLYALLRLQSYFPWYDKNVLSSPTSPDLAFNTAVSFVTTSTWQAYAGESTMSYWSQIAGLEGQNFLAGAAGLAVGIAFIRGFSSGDRTRVLGNFWQDLVRATLWVLLPASIIGSLFLVWQGVPMNFLPYTHATTVEGMPQLIAQGPVAALEFIKNLGTNGGGFFNANGAHPFENPTPLTNFVEMLAIAALPASLTHVFGRVSGSIRLGWMLYGVMVFLFVSGYFLTAVPEQLGNPRITAALHALPSMASPNMEGKEVRFGAASSALTATVTSNCATGSTNSQHDSYLPLSGMIPLINMLLGEIVFGGLGTGIYSIMMIALIAVFVAGLMIGRTPEFLGRKIGAPEMKLVMLFALASPVAILLPVAAAVVLPAGLAGLTANTGPHGFTEIFYAYASCFANNGQSFAGLSSNLPFYNITTAFTMLFGRFALAIPALVLAEHFARARRSLSPAALPTDTFQFGALVTFTALIVVGLGFLPALAIGPILERLM